MFPLLSLCITKRLRRLISRHAIKLRLITYLSLSRPSQLERESLAAELLMELAFYLEPSNLHLKSREGASAVARTLALYFIYIPVPCWPTVSLLSHGSARETAPIRSCWKLTLAVLPVYYYYYDRGAQFHCALHESLAVESSRRLVESACESGKSGTRRVQDCIGAAFSCELSPEWGFCVALTCTTVSGRCGVRSAVCNDRHCFPIWKDPSSSFPCRHYCHILQMFPLGVFSVRT